MKIHRCLYVVLLLICFNVSGNDIIKYRQQVKPLLKQKRYTEAIEVYEKAARETDDMDHNYIFLKDASEIAAEKLKDFKNAEQLATKIKDDGYRKSQLLCLLAMKKQWRELIETYKNEDIGKWPFNCRLESFYWRGMAYKEVGNTQGAVRDLEDAQKSFGGKVLKGRVCLELGIIFQNQLNDDGKALSAYRDGLKVSRSNYAWRNDCFLRMVDILLKQKKSAEALAHFKNIDFFQLPNAYWRGLFLLKYASVLRAEKYNGQAATQLVKIIRMGDALEAHKKAAQKELDELIKEMESD